MKRLILVCLVLACSALSAESLDALESIAREAGSLDEFLNNPPLVRRYFEALEAYYGRDRIRPSQFFGMIDQLRILKGKVPELKERLWETEGIGKPFSISLAATSYGRKLDAKAWTTYQATLSADLEKEAAFFFGSAPPATEKAKIKSLFAKFAKEAAALETSLQNKPRAESARQRSDFYGARKKDPQLRAAAAYLLREKLESEAVRDKLGSGDPNLILDTMNKLRNGLRFAFEKEGIKLGPEVSLLQERVPSLTDLLARTEIFPHEMRTTKGGKQIPVGRSGITTYHFRPVPRRFHGIWKGLPLKECVAECSERWATVALAGTQFYNVERETTGPNGEKTIHYEGFTQHIPLQNARGEIVGSTDFGAPALRQIVAWQAPTLEDPVKLPLYDLWLMHMKERVPEQWQGLAVGSGDHIDNAGVLSSVVHDDASYLEGKKLGQAAAWKHTDPIAAKIVGLSQGDEYGYAGDMIFDARSGKKKIELRLLGDSFSETISRNDLPEEISRTFASPDLNGKVRLLRTLSQQNILTEAQLARLFTAPNYEQVRNVLEARKITEGHPASYGKTLFSAYFMLGAPLLAGSGAYRLFDSGFSLSSLGLVIAGVPGLLLGAANVAHLKNAESLLVYQIPKQYLATYLAHLAEIRETQREHDATAGRESSRSMLQTIVRQCKALYRTLF